MTQKPAYTSDQIIAAAMAMFTRGIGPTRTGLWRELGARGQPQTVWKVWCDHHEKRARSDIHAGVLVDQNSPELSEVIQAHHMSLSAVIDRARKDVAVPLEQRITALEAMISRELADKQDLSELVDALTEALEERDLRVSDLSLGKDRPKLILP